MSGKSAIKLAVILVGILLLLGGGYFLRCTARNPLFLYNRELDPDAYPYRYFFGDRLEFCRNFLFQPKLPKGEDKSVAIPIMGSQSQFQIAPGQTHPSYSSQPPTSGWNYELSGTYEKWKTPRHKTYQDALEPEVAVRRLYIGFVWVTFRHGNEVSEKQIIKWKERGDSDETIEQRIVTVKETKRAPEPIIEELKKITDSTPLVFVTGRAIQDTDIALTALGRQDKFNLENGQLTQEHIDRIWDFILRYRNHSKPPEPKQQPTPMDEPPEDELSPEQLTPDEFDENL